MFIFLQKISERAFDGLNVLRRLRLEDNKLLMLEHGVFTGVPALRYLDLSNNRLPTITFVNILPLWDNLVNTSSTLDLTGMLSFFSTVYNITSLFMWQFAFQRNFFAYIFIYVL